MKRLQKGFTLIELLVVIAIIGILAAVVLVNVTSARNKAREAAIISALSQIRSDKELNFASTGYIATTGQILNTISNNGGQLTESNTATTYRSSSPLPTTPVTYYCVDSTGASKKVSTNPTGAACP
jgi:type IV pilus assembly protein PilA